MMMKRHLISKPIIPPSLIFLFVTICFSNHGINSVIFLKTGNSIPFTISKIHEWGIINEKGQTASFKVIDSLFTGDSSMAYKIYQIDNTIEIKQKVNGFLLNFINYSVPQYVPNNLEPFAPKSLSLTYHYDSKSRIGCQFAGKLFNYETLIFRFHASLGFSTGEEVYSNFNLAVGLGYHADYDITTVSFVTSYGKYGSDQHERDKPGISSVFFFSTIMTYNIKTKTRLNIVGGFDVFLYRSQKELPLKPYTIFLGLGIKLK